MASTASGENVAAIRLGHPLPDASAQPTRTTGRETGLMLAHRAVPIRSCSRWGFPCRRRCRRARWALTPPFHPCHTGMAVCFLWHFPSGWRFRVSPAGRYPASCFPGARTFLRRSLSALAAAATRPAGAPQLGAGGSKVKHIACPTQTVAGFSAHFVICVVAVVSPPGSH